MVEEILERLRQLENANAAVQEEEKHKSSVKNDVGVIVTQLNMKLKKNARQVTHATAAARMGKTPLVIASVETKLADA